MKRFLKNCAYWLAHFLYYVVLILTIGSALGAFFFTIFGMIFGNSHTIPALLLLIKKGLWAGFRYSGVWAGGLSIVLCFLKGGRKRSINAS